MSGTSSVSLSHSVVSKFQSRNSHLKLRQSLNHGFYNVGAFMQACLALSTGQLTFDVRCVSEGSGPDAIIVT